MRKMMVCLVLVSCLSACAQTVLKAPCNASGSHCWPRTKINQWDNSH